MSFNEKLPEWNDPGVEPPQSKKDAGFNPGEKPPAQWFNWLLNRIYKSIQELREKVVVKIEGKGLSTNDYTSEEKNKLAGIEAGATKYVHPSTHPASIIEESTVKRFVSDTEKVDWNSKETPSGAQARANAAETNAKNYASGLVGVLSSLATTAKTNIVAAINELKNTLDNKVDKISGKDLSTNDYTTTEKNKLGGIETGANKYTHPSTHPASMITEETNKRFMTDSERTKLSGIAAGAQVNAVTSVAGKTGAVTISKSDVGMNNVDNVKQMPIGGGTFTGIATAHSNTSYTVRQMRNIILSPNDADVNSMQDGDIWIKYK